MQKTWVQFPAAEVCLVCSYACTSAGMPTSILDPSHPISRSPLYLSTSIATRLPAMVSNDARCGPCTGRRKRQATSFLLRQVGQQSLILDKQHKNTVMANRSPPTAHQGCHRPDALAPPRRTRVVSCFFLCAWHAWQGAAGLCIASVAQHHLVPWCNG